MKNLILQFVFSVFMVVPAFAVDKKVVDHLQSVSLTVETNGGSGSGVIKIKKQGNDNVAFVFTAAHVVDSLRTVKEIIDSRTGTKRTVVEFKDARVVQVTVEDGRTIGKTELYAQVVKFNSMEDLALLRIRKKNFTTESVEFYLDKDIPSIGTNLVHVGSFLGEKLGSASLSTGVISQIGRLIEDEGDSTNVFDQTTVVAFPGSSGGGVYLESNGKLIGMLLRGIRVGDSFNFICPVRRITAWAKRAGIEWAVRDDIPFPSEDVLKKIIIEDSNFTFETDKSRANGGLVPSPHYKNLNKMIYIKDKNNE